MAVGAIYYNPKVVGGLWMRATGLDEERLGRGNKGIIFGLAYLFSLLAAVALAGMVVHQLPFSSLFITDPAFVDQSGELHSTVTSFIEQTDVMQRHRSFGHGAMHGIFTALTFAGSILAINALFERRRWNYVLIHVGYWTITLGLMGGVLGQFLELYF